MPDTKTCKDCKKTLPIDNFEILESRYGNGKIYRRSVCRPCKTNNKAKQISSSPEAYLKTLSIQLRSSRRKGNIVFEVTDAEIISLWAKQNGRCALSGVPMTYQRGHGVGKKDFNASIDRINPMADYTIDNIQLVTTRVNLMKHTLGEDMLMWWIRTIYEHIYQSKQ